MSHLEFLNLTCRLDEGNFPSEIEDYSLEYKFTSTENQGDCSGIFSDKDFSRLFTELQLST